ncbi:MAG: hypothetical protein WA862_03655 [Solirubrobacterales bacterium]
MEGVRKLVLALALTALLAAGLAACGGDADDSSATGTAATKQEAPSSGSADAAPEDDSAAGSTSFRTPGGDNSIQNFGEEADAAEVDAAGAALAGYLRARSEDDWAGQCAYLAAATVAPLEELAMRSPQIKGKGCAAVLPALTAGAPKSTRANTMTAGIASLRFEGDRGFALYHGTRGVDYFVPMTREGGEWKVGALAPTEFP